MFLVTFGLSQFQLQSAIK